MKTNQRLIFRKATMADVPEVHRMINDYAQEGLMLRRPLMQLYESVRDFSVVEGQVPGEIIATSGLHILWHDLAEIRSLSVRQDLAGKGIGRQMIEFLVDEARQLGVARVFALTYNRVFFEKCGFKVIKKETLPQKVWKECIYCDQFHSCNEIALIRYLVPPTATEAEAEIPLVDIPRWTVD